MYVWGVCGVCVCVYGGGGGGRGEREAGVKTRKKRLALFQGSWQTSRTPCEETHAVCPSSQGCSEKSA